MTARHYLVQITDIEFDWTMDDDDCEPDQQIIDEVIDSFVEVQIDDADDSIEHELCEYLTSEYGWLVDHVEYQIVMGDDFVFSPEQMKFVFGCLQQALGEDKVSMSC